jgi:exonuclease VII large subunit
VQVLHEAHDDDTVTKENHKRIDEAWKTLAWRKRWSLPMSYHYYYESDELYSKIVALVKNELKKQDTELQKKQEDYVRRRLAAKLSMNDKELEEFEMQVEDKYEAKIDKKVVLTERNQLACEVNDANLKSAASARERRESLGDRLIMTVVDAGVRAVVQGVLGKLFPQCPSNSSEKAKEQAAPVKDPEAPKVSAIGCRSKRA